MRAAEDNIKMDVKETGNERVGWIQLAQDRPVMVSCEHGNESSGSTKGGEFLD
jgi:hypothetical protein